MINISRTIRHSINYKNLSSIKYILLVLSVMFTTLSINSCKKAIEIDPPATQLATTSVFENNSTATAAVLSLYAQMVGDPWAIHRFTALSSDEFTNYATDQTSQNAYMNSLNSQIDASNLYIWSSAYSYIYQTNAIIENLQISTGVSSKIKQQLLGEALFIRSYWYFNLINFYGDVPLVITADYKSNAVMSRTSKEIVYEQAVSDLKNAQNLLNSNYVDASDTASTGDRIRPNKGGATALLARIYLYTNDWSKAEEQASTLINNTAMYDTVALNKVFLINSKEAIWQIPPTSGSLYTRDGGNFQLTASPASTLNNSTSLSPNLLNAFETNDNRKNEWVKIYTNSSGTWYFPYKYRAGTNSPALTEYTMIFRLAEQYLIRAEARVKQNNNNGAIDDLNVIRKRARLSSLSYSLTQAQILTAIAHERQVELFTEGDRWFNIKRTGEVDNIMKVVTPIKSKGVILWESYQQIYPIPITDIQNDPNLEQNIGYQ